MLALTSNIGQVLTRMTRMGRIRWLGDQRRKADRA